MLPKVMFGHRWLLIDFRERRREGDKEEEKYQLVASPTSPSGNQTYNLGLCPDPELNPWAFSLWDNTPTNWATSARAGKIFYGRFKTDINSGWDFSCIFSFRTFYNELRLLFIIRKSIASRLNLIMLMYKSPPCRAGLKTLPSGSVAGAQ